MVWPGKTTEVERVSPPFQKVERVNEVLRSASGQARLRDGGELPDWWPDGWRNKLIWGDNKYVLRALLKEFAGQIDLIYIDPPFATGANFTVRAQVGEQTVEKQASAVEELAYRDTWKAGVQSYLSMMYPRLLLLRDLLKPTGSIYVHCDDTVGHYLKALLDEIFERDQFRNELIWRRAISHSDANRYGRIVDHILFYARSDDSYWSGDAVAMPKSKEELDESYPRKDARGHYRSDNLTAAGASGGESGAPWRQYDITPKNVHWRPPRTGAYAYYIDRHLIPGYLEIEGVHDRLDALDGAGMIVHPKRGFWPGLKRYAEADTGKLPQSLILDPTGYTNYTSKSGDATGYPTEKPPDLLNLLIPPACPPGGLVLDVFAGSGATLSAAEGLGRRWIGADLGRFAIHTARKRMLDITDCRPFEILNVGGYERSQWQGADVGEQIGEYYDFIVELYGATRIHGFNHLHGIKGDRMVHVGATDAPVTGEELELAISECAEGSTLALDVLGWEWEMGLNPSRKDELAHFYEVDVHLLNIPREVMDQKAVEAGDIHFFELSVVELEHAQDDRGLVVEITNFLPAVDHYMAEKVGDAISQWSDWIDYWSIDFEYDGETFINSWQSYRTRQDRSLSLTSDPHRYDTPGKKTIVVKVIDIFGNDTTRELTVEVE